MRMTSQKSAPRLRLNLCATPPSDRLVEMVLLPLECSTMRAYVSGIL